jgi:hypothetical protein
MLMAKRKKSIQYEASNRLAPGHAQPGVDPELATK